MRLRVGVVLCLLAAPWGLGCRQPLIPNTDRNQPPETWVTAAPVDTVTLVKGERPQISKIPFRFHVYWAGSDHDGAVAGFYWAVVETLARIPEGQLFLPNLPGPRASQYQYTTRTDSTFIFNVAEDIPDRMHAFFIYAVDNQGKPDPTPARFIFNAEDRFPPLPCIDATAIGDIYEPLPGGGVRPVRDTVRITDIDRIGVAPRDTVPSNSALYFKWEGKAVIPGTVVTGYRYKLDEPQLVKVGPEVTSVTYNSGIPPDNVPPSAGTKIFLLRVVDQAQGSQDSTRRFQYNFSPDTWWSGPDLSNPAWQTKPNGEKYLPLSGLGAAGIAGSFLGPDSVQILPALRPDRRTFIEIWKDTVYARAEFDTVHMNSWLLIHGGGFDKDSPYRVRVTDLARLLPRFPGGVVLDPDSANGSPVGFVSLVQTVLSFGSLSRNSLSFLYPVFDPNDVFHQPTIGGYQAMFQSGKAYALMRAEDGDGARDGRVIDPSGLADRVDRGGGSIEDQALRSKVLVFYVNRPPIFLTGSPLFRPRTTAVDTFTQNNWDLRIVAGDSDPFIPGTPLGGPSQIVTLRRKIAVHGTSTSGGLLTYRDPATYLNQQDISFLVPNDLAPGEATIEVELCDCDQCEFNPGTGRCTTIRIPVFFEPTTPH